MKAIHGFPPAGVLRRSNSAPGEIVAKPPKAAQIVVAQRRRPEGVSGRYPTHSEPLVLVTHQVTVTALTGVFPCSGEGVVAMLGENGE